MKLLLNSNANKNDTIRKIMPLIDSPLLNFNKTATSKIENQTVKKE